MIWPSIRCFHAFEHELKCQCDAQMLVQLIEYGGWDVIGLLQLIDLQKS